MCGVAVVILKADFGQPLMVGDWQKCESRIFIEFILELPMWFDRSWAVLLLLRLSLFLREIVI